MNPLEESEINPLNNSQIYALKLKYTLKIMVFISIIKKSKFLIDKN